MRWISARNSQGQELFVGVDAEGQFWVSDSQQPQKLGPASAVQAQRDLSHGKRDAHVLLRLPDGRQLRSQDLETLSAWFPQLSRRRKPMRPGAIVLILLASLVLLIYATIRFIIPTLGDWAAGWVPRSLEQSLQAPVQASLAAQGFGVSALDSSRQQHYRSLFKDLVKDLDNPGAYTLQFHSFAVPNAFALPGGLVVFTDPMFELLQSDAEFIAVAAHEIGHVEKRHIVRNLMRASTFTLLATVVAGDVGSAVALADSVPGLLLSSAYSRDFEREADQFAFEMLKRRQLSPELLGQFLQRLNETTGGDLPGVLRYASSHPATEERIEAARKASQ